MLTLLIVRHGNTFDKGDCILRVGLKTDLNLSSSGIAQCDALGKKLKKSYPIIDHVFCSELKRTRQSAEKILHHFPNDLADITPLKELNEVDYGIDDGKPETQVIARLGKQALIDWDERNLLPNGWQFDVNECKRSLNALTRSLIQKHDNKTLLLVTSNGIARFFPSLLNDIKSLQIATPLKMPTASVSEFTFDNTQQWQCTYWGVRL